MEYLKLLDPCTKKSRFFSDKVKSFATDSYNNFYCIHGLRDCYIRPSENKKAVYDRCIDFCEKYVRACNDNGANNGIKDYGVISHNDSFFTFACVVGVYATAPEIDGRWLYDKAIIITPSKMFEIIL